MAATAPSTLLRTSSRTCGLRWCAMGRRLASFRGSVHARLRVSVRAAMATSARSASFTDFESGKASTNFGSRSTTLVPRRYLSVYLPRTPPEKSYSALIARVRRLEGGFFVVASFMLCRRACADQADPLSSNSMNHNQQISLTGHSDDDEALFADGLIRVWDRDRKRVVEDGARLRKSDPVLAPICRILSSIPLKSDSIHLPLSLADRKQLARERPLQNAMSPTGKSDLCTHASIS